MNHREQHAYNGNMNKNKRLDKIMNQEKKCKNCIKLQQNYNSQFISNSVDYEKEIKELK